VSPAALTAKECAFLTMLLPSPRRYHAYFRRRQLTQWADRRVNRILQIMLRMGYIEDGEYQTALAEQLWGNPVLPDTSPGVPADPGEVTETPNDQFEPVTGEAVPEEAPGGEIQQAEEGKSGGPENAPAEPSLTPSSSEEPAATEAQP
jgi:membrane peptidoglycan carboxypeptidase